LKVAFDKYLPAVLNNGETKKVVQKQSLTESKLITEVTGDKAAKKQIEHEDQDKLIEFKRLAGL
jgi:hypothetical protein